MTFTIINASAGSGKTFALTHALADRIRDGLEPSRLIATTFTKKAAAELSTRIGETLLDAGLIEQSRAAASAMVGTVNSVAGRLVQEYAIDAGLSPDLRELDEDAQKHAFAAAIDASAADAEDAHADLLARTGHDGEPDNDFPNATPSWIDHVRKVATLARTNVIGAQAVRDAAEQSWESFRDAALPAPDSVDRRTEWLAGLSRAIDDLDAALETGVYTTAGGVTKKIDSRSINATKTSLEHLATVQRRLSASERAPWGDWAKLARIATDAGMNSKGTDPANPKPLNKVAAHVLYPLAQRIADELLANPVLQDDIRTLIGLVLETAADSLDAYQDYKRELGLIDFTDQEVLALELLRSNERVRSSISSRFRLLAVDEFQDTSPVQLALFLELSGLIDDKIWVGDPKQAIYGFRDADPTLMLGIIQAIERGGTDFGTGQVTTLAESWRSSRAVLGLSNALFTRVFPEFVITDPETHEVLSDRVSLSVPEPRRETSLGGHIEAWTATGPGRKSQPQHAQALADGVASMIERGTPRGDIAVLTRSNRAAGYVIDELEARGVPASGATRPLCSAREGQILRAALGTVLDSADTLALVELVSLLPDHAAHDTWFQDLAAATDQKAREMLFGSWWDDPALTSLRELREACIDLTPLEMVESLIDAVDLSERILSWSDPSSRFAALDSARALAVRYADEARSRRKPVTLTGLRSALDAADAEADLSGRSDSVWVGTVHGAKGLEWPHVVVMLPEEKERKFRRGGARVLPAPELDPAEPLEGRRIHYWPELLESFAPLTDRLDSSRIIKDARARDRQESARVQYVALTRAARTTSLCAQTSAGQFAEIAPVSEEADGAEQADGTDGAPPPAPEPLITWDADAGTITVCGETAVPLDAVSANGEAEDGSAALAAASARPTPGPVESDAPDAAPCTPGITDLDPRVLILKADPDDPVVLTRDDDAVFTDIPVRAPERTHAPSARFTASEVAADPGSATRISLVADVGEPLVSTGGEEWNRVGEAVHGYLALPHEALDADQRAAAAARLCSRWRVERVIGPDRIIEGGGRWRRFLADRFPGAVELTEQPIAWWNEDAQAMEGWIDSLLRLPDGRLVIVDHKSYPGKEPEAHIREHYLGQLATYAQAITAATGSAPARVLVHLPLRGEVWEVAGGPGDPGV